MFVAPVCHFSLTPAALMAHTWAASSPGTPTLRLKHAGQPGLCKRQQQDEHRLEGRGLQGPLGAYRVFNCDGTVATDWLLGALDQATADGMNLINLSMGTSWAAPLGLSFATRLAK